MIRLEVMTTQRTFDKISKLINRVLPNRKPMFKSNEEYRIVDISSITSEEKLLIKITNPTWVRFYE